MIREMRKVLVVDHHRIVVPGCQYLLQDFGVTHFLGASSVEEAREIYRRELPDVIILELAIPGEIEGGIELIRHLREQERRPAIIVFSEQSDPDVILKAVKLGVDAYILKSDPAHELQTGVRSVLSGRGYLSAGAAACAGPDAPQPIVDSPGPE